MGARKMPTEHLTINTRPTTAPFKSSSLALLPSPFSPLLPITPPASPPKQTLKRRTTLTIASPPPEPLHWLWQCHHCNRVYQLAVTRRCLDDGHYFCSGTTTVRRSKRGGGRKVARHKACASEFDYAGWRAWGEWRRDVREQLEAAEVLEGFLDLQGEGGQDGKRVEECVKKVVAKKEGQMVGGGKKDCWNGCDYPSECRWGVIQIGSPSVGVPVGGPVGVPVVGR